MALNSWEMQLFVADESTHDKGPGSGATVGVFAASDAVLHLNVDFGPEQKARTRHRKDRTGFRSPSLTMVHGSKDPVDAEITCSLAPSGAAGTAPDTGLFLKNAFGTETITGSTSAAYTVLKDPSGTLALVFADPDREMALYLFGAVVSQRKVAVNDEEPMDSFSIQATRRASIMKDTLGAAIADNLVTSLTVSNPKRFANAHGCVILIESEEILLSTDPADFNYSTGVFSNVTRGHNSTAAAAHIITTVVYPSVPTSMTTAGVPIGEHQVTASFGGVSWVITSGEIVFDTGRGHRAPERGSAYVQGVVNRKLKVTASLEGVLDVGADTELLGDAVQNTSGAVVLTIGDVAGSIDTLTVADAEIMVAKSNFPEDDLVTGSIEFTGQGSSGNDDLAETYT